MLTARYYPMPESSNHRDHQYGYGHCFPSEPHIGSSDLPWRPAGPCCGKGPGYLGRGLPKADSRERNGADRPALAILPDAGPGSGFVWAQQEGVPARE